MTAREHLACEFLENSRDYLKTKSFYGDGAEDYLTKWEWMVSTCSAIGIINDTISRIYMEGQCAIQK